MGSFWLNWSGKRILPEETPIDLGWEKATYGVSVSMDPLPEKPKAGERPCIYVCQRPGESESEAMIRVFNEMRVAHEKQLEREYQKKYGK